MAGRSEVRREAKRRGIDFETVRDIYAELRERERLDRDWEWTLRQRVWEWYRYTPESQGFWRHGMHKRFSKAFGEGDRTVIPGWDVVAQSIAGEFPELHNGGDCAETLYEIIREPHNTLPPADDTWEQALELATPVGVGADDDDVPF